MQHYQSNEALKCYITYIALKRHFTSNYDFFKYNGKVKVSIQSFEARRDKFQFARLAKRSDWKELMLANMLVDPNKWVGDLEEQHLIDMKKRREALTYHYTQDLKKLDHNFNSNFQTEDGQHPLLLRLFLGNQISIDTMVILESLVKYIKHWDKNITETIIWPKQKLLIEKYKPFLRFDEEKMKSKTLQLFS